MKFLDEVKVVKDSKEYAREGVFKGMIGTIINGEIRDNCFHVVFSDPRFLHENFDWTEKDMKNSIDDIFCSIKIEDLELVKDFEASDSYILEDLSKQDPRWWCKVENGYIINLLGERKNKIPYDYKS